MIVFRCSWMSLRFETGCRPEILQFALPVILLYLSLKSMDVYRGDAGVQFIFCLQAGSNPQTRRFAYRVVYHIGMLPGRRAVRLRYGGA
jgi:hypothetical protein